MSNASIPILFKKKEDCCGCSACSNVCPSKAISMKPDQYGFLYPEIDRDLCEGCSLCVKVCAFQNKVENAIPQEVYAAVDADPQLVRNSSSGGIFASIAKQVLLSRGVIFGCSMESRDSVLCPEHIKVESLCELQKLQGSKYVQSMIGTTYKYVEEELETGRFVLFSGTPCQVAALKNTLGNKAYPNLLTIDLICHGVPSSVFFQDYLKFLEEKLKGDITAFTFKEKKYGWGHNARVTYHKNGQTRSKKIRAVNSSYYNLFLQSDVERDSCYQCKYASPHRPADLTIGDFWGIENVHPDYLKQNGGSMNIKSGISCVLINTEQGKKQLEAFGLTLACKPSSFENVLIKNNQLQRPCRWSTRRQCILEMYKNDGYAAVDNWYFKQIGIKRYAYLLWDTIPIYVKKQVVFYLQWFTNFIG